MRFVLIYCSILILGGCSKEKRDDCFTSLGEDVTIIRSLSPDFNRLYIDDRIELKIYQDSAKSGLLELTAPEGLISQISSSLSDGKLSIQNENTCNFVRSYNYSISGILYVEELIEITTQSIASIDVPDTLRIRNLSFFNNSLANSSLVVKGNSVLVESFNSANTKLSGSVATLRASIEEVSELDASELLAEEIILDTHTPFDTYINALRGIYVKIYNSGDVVYTNEPTEYKIAAERTGTGKLRIK